MKKILVLIMFAFLISGCNLGNTPTSKVEDLMTKYQKLDSEVVKDIDLLLEENDLTEEEKNDYRKIIEKQYENLTYEIKDEKTDGDTAIVTIQIEVLDYKKVVEDIDTKYASLSDYTKDKYYNDKLQALKKAKEKITYTLEIEVDRDSKGNWEINKLDQNSIKKIQGMY